MPDYQESAVAGTKWNRFYRIEIDNTHRAVPVVYIYEEQVVSLDDSSELRRPVSTLEMTYSPDYPISVRIPLTGEATGETVTMAYVYQLLYSACLQQALIRDGAIQSPNSTQSD